MEARDTVMTYEQTKVVVDELVAEGTDADRVSLLRTEFEAQAEITFPLGKQEGIKLVGDWIAQRAGLVKGVAPVKTKYLFTYIEIKTLQNGEIPKVEIL